VGVSPATIGHGGTVTIRLSGDCFQDTFTIVVHSKERTLGTISTDPAGMGMKSFALPCAVNVGRHMVTASDALGNTGAAPLRVTPAPCASAPGHDKGRKPPPSHRPHQAKAGSDLRIAGVNATAAMPAGAAAVGVTGLLILSGRKRRRRRDFGSR